MLSTNENMQYYKSNQLNILVLFFGNHKQQIIRQADLSAKKTLRW